MAGGGVTSREQIISLLKNQEDLAVKQAKDILCSIEPSSLVADLFPYIVELQGSNEVLVRKILLEFMEELGLKVMDQSSVFMPVFLALLKDGASSVVRQSIVSGTNFYCGVLKEMALQYRQSGKVERWLEELWSWMVEFKNAICGIALEAGPISTKLLAIKFLEMNVLHFTSDANDDETSSNEVKGQNLNITWVVGGQPMLDPGFLTLEANRSLGYLLDMLRSAKTLPGCVTITVISCLAAIARKRPMHYTRILSALLGFDPNFETPRSHAASIKYSLRIAFLGFLKCTHRCIVESRDILVKAAHQVIREVDNKIVKNTERASRVVRFNKEHQKSNPFLPVAGELNKKRSMLQDVDSKGNYDEPPAKRTRCLPVENAEKYSGDDEVRLMQNESTPVEQMIAMIASLLAEGERGPESLEILISRIQPDLMADIVIAIMKHLPKNSPPLSSRLGNMPVPSSLSGPSFTASQVKVSNVPTTTYQQSPVFQSQAVTPFSSAKAMGAPSADLKSASALSVDLERDPRRDPRRLPASAAAVQPLPAKEISRFAFDALMSVDSPVSVQVSPKVDPSAEVYNSTLDVPPSELIMDLEPVLSLEQSDFAVVEPELQNSNVIDLDQNSPVIPGTSAPDETFHELPPVPSYIELTGEEQNHLSELAVGRLIESSRQIHATGCSQTCMELLARLVLQTAADQYIVSIVQKHIISDYEDQQGHELAMHVLYHLHSVVNSCNEFSSFAESIYEKVLLSVAKSLQDTLPASDKSFSRFLGEVPLLPDSALKLLEDLCRFDNLGKDVRDGEHVTQSLGADGAFNCSVHPQYDVRAKAIHLVANKFYQLSYASDTEPSQVGSTNPEENMEMEDLHLLRSHGTTIVGKHIPSLCVYMAADGREASKVMDVNGRMKVIKEAYTSKTEILWDRVLLGGAGDSSWLADIIEELKNVPADYGWTAKDCADYAHFIMKGYYLKDSNYEKLTCHFLFASYIDEAELYFASRDEVQKIVDNVKCIGTGGKHARKYLKRRLGHQTFAAHVNDLISAVEYASEHDPYTGDRVTVHRVSRDHGVNEQDIQRSDIHLVRQVDEPDIQREVSEDTMIHILTRKVRKIERREAANRREANQN
ncbi:uncharacterized protein LOC113311935 [Papaver somniferum]|uniref:uncharacterized protein LOC113311935 n=1 Tax=Papaver somniferum TaxID=3469 RepID=UPI000E6FC007|nr:uncharacterized protein LOC113311935 [Papaver somniferum]